MEGEIREGSEMYLTVATSYSRVGFSVRVGVVTVHPREKGQRKDHQKVTVRLPSYELITVWVSDLYSL